MAKSVLTVKEAAVLAGRSERTIRRLIQEGKVGGSRGEGGWRVRTDQLMQWLGDCGGSGLGTDRLRREVEAALAGVVKPRDGSRQAKRGWYSVTDLKAFTRAQPVYRRLAVLLAGESRNEGLARAASALAEGLDCLSIGCHTWRRPEKIGHYSRARSSIARAASRLLLASSGDDKADPAAELAAVLEQGVLPAISGLIRRLERKS